VKDRPLKHLDDSEFNNLVLNTADSGTIHHS